MHTNIHKSSIGPQIIYLSLPKIAKFQFGNMFFLLDLLLSIGVKPTFSSPPPKKKSRVALSVENVCV